MKKMLVMMLSLLLLVGCGVQTTVTEETTAEESVTQEAETASFGTFSAETLDGETLTEAIFAEADLTVVNLWGTFCGPCIQEMPTLGMLHDELENVQFLGIVLDCNDEFGGIDPDQAALAMDIMAQAGAEYDCLVLNQSLASIGMANFQYIPTTLFVDRDGNLVGTEIVGAKDEAGWRETIAQRLEMVQ